MSKPERLGLETADITSENIERIAALFPNCLTERKNEAGRVVKAIDFDMLRQELSHDIVEGPQERYQFNWPEKRKAIRLANAPTDMTLRPCREDSVNFDTTQNLYIEGDNLEVLKLLRENYLGKVKMIYIDPPYNTGKEFVYNDDFVEGSAEWKMLYERDEAGNKLDANTESNGRFHTDWLNMMYPRLKVAKDLLSEDGVIFISIDDNEVDNLRKVCDEIFGTENFLAQCVRKRRDSQANLSKNISPIHEYVVIYCRRNGDILHKIAASIDESEYKNPDNDQRGPYKTMPCTNKGGSVYVILTPTGKEINEEWRFKKETYEALFNDNRIVFPRGGDGKPRYKLFLSEKKEEGQLANTWLDTLASNQDATREIKALFDEMLLFDTPKPVGLLEFCLQLATKTDSLILDFFSGSATTAHAVMKLNAEDGGKRKFIMVQLPEPCEEKGEAFKAGYKNICEIGKERIRRAGKKILEENATTAPNLDIGFRVLKLDSSNMEEVKRSPSEFAKEVMQGSFDFGEAPQVSQATMNFDGGVALASNIKPGRTDEDLLFQVMPRFDIPLSAKIAVEEIGGKKVFVVDDGYLMASFDRDLTESVLAAIAKRKPAFFAMCDGGYATDNVADNFEQIWREYSPETVRRVI